MDELLPDLRFRRQCQKQDHSEQSRVGRGGLRPLASVPGFAVQHHPVPSGLSAWRLDCVDCLLDDVRGRQLLSLPADPEGTSWNRAALQPGHKSVHSLLGEPVPTGLSMVELEQLVSVYVDMRHRHEAEDEELGAECLERRHAMPGKRLVAAEALRNWHLPRQLQLVYMAGLVELQCELWRRPDGSNKEPNPTGCGRWPCMQW